MRGPSSWDSNNLRNRRSQIQQISLVVPNCVSYDSEVKGQIQDQHEFAGSAWQILDARLSRVLYLQDRRISYRFWDQDGLFLFVHRSYYTQSSKKVLPLCLKSVVCILDVSSICQPAYPATWNMCKDVANQLLSTLGTPCQPPFNGNFRILKKSYSISVSQRHIWLGYSLTQA